MHEILIDVTRLLGRLIKRRLPTGVDRVCQAYIRHYMDRARAIVYWHGVSLALPANESHILFEWLLNPGLDSRVYPIIAKGLLHHRLDRNKLPIAEAILFNIGHSGLEKISYMNLLKRQGVKPIFMVHDLIPLSYPEYCRPMERQKHLARMCNVLEFGSGVVCNSQTTLDELKFFAQDKKLPTPPSVAASLASGILSMASLDESFTKSIAKPYFVMLGTIEPRKNHCMILQVWRRLVQQMGTRAPRLLIIGQRGWECENTIDLLDRCELLKDFVIELSDCSDSMLVSYLKQAQALLFPSFVEGFGMPLVEALALEVPVIASNLSVFKEFANDIPEYIDPLDGKRWCEMIETYMQPDNMPRRNQLLRMVDFSVPTWNAHFTKVDALLEQIH